MSGAQIVSGLLVLAGIWYWIAGRAYDRDQEPKATYSNEEEERDYLIDHIDHSEGMTRYWRRGMWILYAAAAVILYGVVTGN